MQHGRRVVLLALCACSATAVPLAPTDLRVEYLSSSAGVTIGTPVPRFSFVLPAPDARNATVVAYELVLSKMNPDATTSVEWNSIVRSPTSTNQIPFTGPTPLQAAGSYSFRVRWWCDGCDDDEAPSAFSDPMPFQMSLLGGESDWDGAEWLGSEDARVLRLKFDASRLLTRSTLFLAAPGCAVVRVNDVVVGEQHGVCPWTQFCKTILYNAINLTDAVVPGVENTLTLTLGHMFYTSQAKGAPSARVKLILEGSDLSVTNITSSSTSYAWSTLNSTFSILSDDPFLGTSIDWRYANLTTVEWASPVNASASPPPGALVQTPMPPSRFQRTVQPVNIVELNSSQLDGPGKAGDFVFDFGENFVGQIRVRTSAITVDTSDQKVDRSLSFIHAEEVYPDGSILINFTNADPNNYQKDVHGGLSVLRDDPSFKDTVPFLDAPFSYKGFQYVQVSGRNAALLKSLDAIEGLVIATDVATTSSLELSDGFNDQTASTLLDIQKMTFNGQRSNMAAGAVTDCPTREKRFWTGDALDSLDEAVFNFDMASIYSFALYEMVDDMLTSGDIPGALPAVADVSACDSGMTDTPVASVDISWSAFFVGVALKMVHEYGDLRLATDHFEHLTKYANLLIATANATECGLATTYTWGDWCPVQDRSKATPTTGPPLAAMNYIAVLDGMSELCTILGVATGSYYEEHAISARSLYYESFFNESAGLFNGNGEIGYDLDAQSLTVAPLSLGGVIPDADVESVVAALVENIQDQDFHLTTGATGAKFLFSQLTRHGQHDTAVRVATQRTFPGFGWWLENGATTCWENWSGKADASHPPQVSHVGRGKKGSTEQNKIPNNTDPKQPQILKESNDLCFPCQMNLNLPVSRCCGLFFFSSSQRTIIFSCAAESVRGCSQTSSVFRSTVQDGATSWYGPELGQT